MTLPSMVYATRKSEVGQVAFGGLDHSESADASAFYDMENLSSDLYPILAPRARRWKICDRQGVKGLCAIENTLWFLHDGKLCKTEKLEKVATDDGSIDYMAAVEEVLEASATDIVRFGRRLILPCLDEDSEFFYLVYDTESGESRRMDASHAATARIGDGTLFGVSAEQHVIDFESEESWEDWGFRESDAVHIELREGSSGGEPLMSTDAVIRELNGAAASFDEYLFANVDPGTYWVSVERKVPPLRYFCECNNRLFACSGDTVYASALGDPFNWYLFDGISTDSWSVETGGGKFTGCIEYLGSPYFFKVDAIYKLYGDYPSEYRLGKTDAFGVKEEAEGSLAVVGSTLYYLSTAGIAAYSGGYPTVILSNEQMGGNPSRAYGGAGDYQKYYVCVRLYGYSGGDLYYDRDDQTAVTAMYVYDTIKGVWHKEDSELRACCMSGYPEGGVQRNLFGYNDEGIWLMGTPAFTASLDETGVEEWGRREGAVESFAEFGECFHDALSNKKLWRLHLRLWVARGARVKLSIAYDGGRYKVLREFGQTEKRSVVIPIAAKLYDRYRLRIDGKGEYKIYALTKEYAVSGKG